MLVRVAQCTSTQLNPPLFFVRKRYWVLCGELANESLIRIEKFVRNITDLEMFFLSYFSSDYFSCDTKIYGHNQHEIPYR